MDVKFGSIYKLLTQHKSCVKGMGPPPLLSGAHLEEMGRSVSAIPIGNDWWIECQRGEEGIVIASPGNGLEASVAEAEQRQVKRIAL